MKVLCFVIVWIINNIIQLCTQSINRTSYIYVYYKVNSLNNNTFLCSSGNFIRSLRIAYASLTLINTNHTVEYEVASDERSFLVNISNIMWCQYKEPCVRVNKCEPTTGFGLGSKYSGTTSVKYHLHPGKTTLTPGRIQIPGVYLIHVVFSFRCVLLMSSATTDA